MGVADAVFFFLTAKILVRLLHCRGKHGLGLVWGTL